MEAKSGKFIDYLIVLLKNFAIVILYPILLLTLPAFTLFWYKQGVTTVSTIYQVIGIYLLYYEEKYKMDHSTYNYAILNTKLMYILKSWENCKFAFRKIYRIKTNFYKNENKCDIKFDLTVTPISQALPNILNPFIYRHFRKMYMKVMNCYICV